MTRRSHRWSRLATALAGALAVVPLLAAQSGGAAGRQPQGQAGAKGIPTCDGRQVDGLVTVVTPPKFPTPPSALLENRRGPLVDLAVDPIGGLRAWATDGWSIARTDDAGCTWNVVFSLDEADGAFGGADSQTGAIMELAVPDAPGAAKRLYALVQDLSVPGATSRFRVLATEDGGASFALRGQDLPSVNLAASTARCGDDRPCGIAPTGFLDTIYLRFAGTNGTLVYASTDAGRSFQVRRAGTAFVEVGGEGSEPGVRGPLLTDLEVDAANQDLLWGTSAADGPQHSNDGATSFTTHDPFSHFELPLTNVRHIDVTTGAFGQSILAIGDDASGRTQAAVSLDDGLSFQPETSIGILPGDATGAHTTLRYVNVVATTQGLFGSGQPGVGVPGAATPSQIAGPAHGGLRHLQSVHQNALGQAEQLWAVSDREIVTTGVSAPKTPSFPPARPPVDLGSFDPFQRTDPPLGSLDGPIRVDLQPGMDATQLYDLVLPPVDVPVDVFFLLDETGSMQDEFDALQGAIKRIAEDLQDANFDVQVGLGSYGNGFRYRLYRTIGELDDEFLRRLSSIRTGGDGEVAYTGLHTAVTGNGLGRSRAGNGVRSGQDAQFRPNAVKMIIHATDEGLTEEAEGPTVEAAIAALADRGIYHLGLIANDFTNGAAGGVAPGVGGVTYDWKPMFDLAEKTGALAPAGGIDCNNDGIVDVRAGEPIACYLSPATTNETLSDADRIDLIPDLADVIVRMVRSFTEDGVVSVHAQAYDRPQGNSPLLTGFAFPTGSNAAVVNLRRANRLEVVAGVRCTNALAGLTDTVQLLGRNADRIIGRTSLTISCGVGPATPGLVAAIAAPGGNGAVVAAQPAPAPPAPIQAPAPAQGAAQANAVSSANSTVTQVGAAAAQQEQQQAQAASIGPSQDREQPGIAYEFTARRDTRSAPVGATALGALAMTAGATVLARRRRDEGVTTRIHVR